MALGFKNLFNGVNLVPQNTIAVSKDGDLRYNSSINKVELYNGAVDPIVTEGDTATITNKTFDSTSTMTGVKIASFTPDGTHTLTAPTATDILVGKATTDTLTNKTIDAGSNTISNLMNSNLSGSAGITVANGGTGRASLTNHGVLIGAGTSAITQLTAAAAGTVLTGAGATSDPAFSATPTLGVNGTTTGQLNMATVTGGGASVTIQNLGTTSAWNFNLPTSAGTTGQVLTSAGGSASSMTWSSSLTNPMTTGGDIIYGGSAGAPQRLTNGSNGQVLTSSGGTSAPTWTTPVGLTVPSVTNLTSTGTQTGWLFTISTSTTCAVGDTYTNNSNTFTVQGALSAQSGQVLWMSGTGATSGSTLTRATGSGTASITFSTKTATASYTPAGSPLYIKARIIGGGGGGGCNSTSSAGGTGGTTFLGPNLIVANGGVGGTGGAQTTPGTPGTGGTVTVSGSGVATVESYTGQTGEVSTIGDATDSTGGNNGAGASTIFGQGGVKITATASNTTGAAPVQSSGGMGGAGGVGGTGANAQFAASGGGAGGYADVIISGASLLASYPYIIGGAGAGATNANGGNGGNGATGRINVIAYYQ